MNTVQQEIQHNRQVEGLYNVVKFVMESTDPCVRETLRFMPPLDIDPEVYLEVLVKIQLEQNKK